jgi:Zn-dependent membrane protease YugP
MKKYAQQDVSSGKSGAEVARQMLDDNDIYDVEIREVDGFLSDHYNPLNKTLNLSSEIYHGRNVGAIAVAAHECGHAIQHNRGYLFLHLRSMMVPMVSFSARFLNIFIFLGIIMINKSVLPLKVGIMLFAVTTMFSIVTLPVEFNASSRALRWIEDKDIVTRRELKSAKSALTLAAMTYVLAAIGSLAELLRLLSILNSRRED